jgi:hypothetical protein
MTDIYAEEIVAHVFYVRGDPDSPDPAVLFARPGNIRVGRWDAGILSLQQPDGDRRRVSCPNADDAVSEATPTWNTAEGFATLERWIGVQRAAATWTAERRHEWQEPKQLVALAKAAIQQAVKDGVLPMPNDYRVTWRSDDEAIYDTAGEIVLGVYTIDKASLLNCDRLVLAIGVCVSQASTRTMLMARAVKTCCRLVLTRPA